MLDFLGVTSSIANPSFCSLLCLLGVSFFSQSVPSASCSFPPSHLPHFRNSSLVWRDCLLGVVRRVGKKNQAQEKARHHVQALYKPLREARVATKTLSCSLRNSLFFKLFEIFQIPLFELYDFLFYFILFYFPDNFLL